KASPSAEVVGYKIFWGTGSHNYQNVQDVKNALTTSLTLSETKYYVAVTAYSMTANSWLSNEVIVPPLCRGRSKHRFVLSDAASPRVNGSQLSASAISLRNFIHAHPRNPRLVFSACLN